MPSPVPRSREPVSVALLPEKVTVTAYVGDTVLDAALYNGIEIEHECGGNCSCTTCHILVHQGAENLTPMEEPEQYRIQFADGVCDRSRLACQAILRGGSVEIEICG